MVFFLLDIRPASAVKMPNSIHSAMKKISGTTSLDEIKKKI